ncbi:MAG: FAD-dependent oxidoreductase [Bacteroidota bacterium]
MIKKYDIVIIGSGLGGLLCAAILGKNGYSVCVIEKHNQIGGNIQTFKRKGCVFSAGMHFIGSMEKDQILYKILNYIDVAEKINVLKLDESCFERIFIKDEEYSYAMGMENFKNNLISYFPEERVAIEKYTKKLDEIWDAIDILNLREISNDYSVQTESLTTNAYEFIESLTDNKRLKAIISATNALYAGVKSKTPLHVHAVINNFYIKSAWKLDEREVSFAKVLSDSVESFGGTIIKNTEASGLEYDGENIIAAKTKNGDLIYGDTFISNIHPKTTIEIAGKDRFRKVFINRINEIENTISSFGMYIVMKKNTFKHIESDIYYFSDYDVWGTDSYDSEIWPKGFVLYSTPDINNDEYSESITIITYMKYDDVKKWENTYIEKRGADYLEFKRNHAEKLLDVVEQNKLKIRDCIDTYYTSTPLTYRDYTGIPGGALYGTQKDCNNHLNSFLTAKTKIPNLLLTGQNVQMHGILGVAVCALQTCSNIIDYNTLVKDIRNEQA